MSQIVDDATADPRAAERPPHSRGFHTDPSWVRPRRAQVSARRRHYSQPGRRSVGKAVVFVLFIVGILAVMFLSYEFWVSNLTESRSQGALLTEFKHSLVLTDTAALLTPPEGHPVGLMEIPGIGLEQVVVQGIGTSDTKMGPGHDPSTPAPGQAGNSVLIGRRTSYGGPFRHLDRLSSGAAIIIVTREGQFTYRVTGGQMVTLGDTAVVAPTTDDRLTLITSNPPYRAGAELVVTATLVGQGLQAPAPLPLPPPGQRPGLTPDLPAWGPILLWGELLLVAILGTWILYRRRWSAAATYLLTTPVLITLSFLFFGAADRLLPPSL